MMTHTPWYWQEHPYVDVIDTFISKLQDGQKIFRDVSVDYLVQRANLLRSENKRLISQLAAAQQEVREVQHGFELGADTIVRLSAELEAARHDYQALIRVRDMDITRLKAQLVMAKARIAELNCDLEAYTQGPEPQYYNPTIGKQS